MTSEELWKLGTGTGRTVVAKAFKSFEYGGILYMIKQGERFVLTRKSEFGRVMYFNNLSREFGGFTVAIESVPGLAECFDPEP